jgi:hypothetical protein
MRPELREIRRTPGAVKVPLFPFLSGVHRSGASRLADCGDKTVEPALDRTAGGGYPHTSISFPSRAFAI